MSVECTSPELTGPQVRALTLLLAGQPAGNVAYECRVTPRTLNNWLQLPHFREALIAGQSRLIEETWTQLANSAADAIRTLHWISQDTHQKGSVRVAAASKLLDLLFRNAARFTLPAVEAVTPATATPEQPAATAVAPPAALELPAGVAADQRAPVTAEPPAPAIAGVQSVAVPAISIDPLTPVPPTPGINADTMDDEIDAFINAVLSRAEAGTPSASAPPTLNAVGEKREWPSRPTQRRLAPEPLTPPLCVG